MTHFLSQEPPVTYLHALPVGAIAPDPRQPRKHFDEVQLTELADSIIAHGLIEPVIVRPAYDGAETDTYVLIAGERRWRAAQQAGLPTVTAVVRDLTDEEAFVLSVMQGSSGWAVG